jgi:hypothetical protein
MTVVCILLAVGVSFSFTLTSVMLRLAESSAGEIDILLQLNGDSAPQGFHFC